MFKSLVVTSFSLLLIFSSPGFAATGEAERLVNEPLISRLSMGLDEMAKRRLRAWQKLIKQADKLKEKEILEKVNDFFNMMRYKSDIQLVGQPDYWMTPTEFLIAGQGDCEDFSIAKYFTLVAMNIPMEKLRITYVKAIAANQAHMVLAYYQQPKAEPLVLDNITSKILPASERTDLKPVYSFNGEGLWLARQRGEGKLVGKSSRLNLWRKLLQRMRTLREE